MSESDGHEFPADLIPLGIVHNDERREDPIEVVNTAKRKRTITLWAYKGHHSAEWQRVPDNYELNWMGGPGREEGNHTDHPGLTYYCDVTAEIRLRADVPGGYILHAGAADAAVFTQVQISEAVLAQCRDKTRPEIVEVVPILPPVPVALPGSDKPKPSKQKERRQVREAIEALATLPSWSGLKAEPRMRRIEEHLNWVKYQCKRKTYERAKGDVERARLVAAPVAPVAPVGEVAQVPASS